MAQDAINEIDNETILPKPAEIGELPEETDDNPQANPPIASSPH